MEDIVLTNYLSVFQACQSCFKSRMNALLEGLEGVLCLVDDVLVFGSNHKDHDTCLDTVMQRPQNAGVTLNPNNCAFLKDEFNFYAML